MNKKWMIVLCMMLAGTASIVASSTPVISRVYGDYLRNESTSQGQALPARAVSGLDTSYSGDGLVPVASTIGLGSDSIDIIKIIQQDLKLVVAAYDNTSSDVKIFRLNTNGTLDTSFGSSGILTSSVPASVEDMIYDVTNSILLVISSTGASTGTLYSYDVDGGSAVTRGITSTVISGAKLSMLANNTVLVFAKDSTNNRPKILTFAESSLVAGSTYAFNADGSDNSITVKDIISDGNGYVYVAYMVSSTAYVAKLETTEFTLKSGFGTAGRLSFASANDIRIAFDSSNNLAVGVLNSGQNTITVYKVSADTGALGISGTLTPDAGTISLGGVVPSSDGNVFVHGAEVGANSSATQVLIKCLRAGDYAANTLFNTTGVLKLTPTTSSVTARTAPSALILPTGPLCLGVNEVIEVISAVHTPWTVQVNTLANSAPMKRFPLDIGTSISAVSDGSVDTGFGTNGAFKPFVGYYEGALQQQVKSAVLIPSSGNKIMAVMDGKGNSNSSSHLFLAQVTAAGAFDTTFNSTGYYEHPLHGSNSAEYANKMTLDKNNKYVVVGKSVVSSSDNGFLIRFATDGAIDTSSTDLYTVTSSVSTFYDVGVQSNERVIACGKNGTNGRIIGFKGTNLSIDDTFGGSGGYSIYELTGKIIYSLAINGYDNIYFVAHNTSDDHMYLYRLDEQGDVLDDTFNSTGLVDTGIVIDSSKPEQMQVQLDTNGKIIVGCVNSSGDFAVRRYLATGDVDTSFNPDNSGATLTVAVSGDAKLRELKVLNNGQIILAGANDTSDDSMVLVRITSAGVADTTFGTSGVTEIKVAEQTQNSREFKTVVVQSTGALVGLGYESFISAESCPVVVRVNATGDISEVSQVVSRNDGQIDTTLDATGVADLSSLLGNGTATTVYHYKYYHSAGIDSRFIIGYYNGSNSYIARFESDVSLETSFGDAASGITTITGKAHINHLILDADNKILACGGDGSDDSAWLKRFTTVGADDGTTFSLSGFQNAYKVLEQESGRVIVAAEKNDGTLAIVAFQDTGALDTTFNPLGVTPGQFLLKNSGGDLGADAVSGYIDMAIGKTNSTNYGYDRIYVAYKVSNTPKLLRLQDNGIKDTSFNTTGVVTANADAISGSNVRVCVDETQMPSLGYVGTDGTSFVIKRYTSTGAISQSTSASSLGAGTQIGALLPLITSKQVCAMGYNEAGAMLFARTNTSGSALDTVFNSGGSVAGQQSFSGNNSSTLNAATFGRDGRIFAVGATTATAHPTLVRVHGSLYLVEWEQHPRQSSIATFDQTWGTAGVVDYTGSTYLNAAGYRLKRVYQYDGANGKLLLAFDDNSSNVKLMRLKADRTLDTTFGDSSSGILTLSSGSILTSPSGNVTPKTINDLYVNRTGDIYICGQNTSNKSWLAKVTSFGALDTTFKVRDTVLSGFKYMNKIVQFTDTKLIVSYLDTSNNFGMSSFNALTGAIDTTFDAIVLGVNSGVSDQVVDQYNRIYTAYHNGARLYLRAYLSYGTVQMTYVNPFGDADVNDATGVQLAINTAANRIVVAVKGADNTIRMRAYTYTTDNTLTPATNAVAIGSSISALANMRIDNAGNVYVAGYDTSYNIVVARLNSSLEPDTAYDSDGVAVISNATSSLNRVTDMVLHPDRRVELFGYNSSTSTGYAARLFGDVYTTQIIEEITQSNRGVSDLVIDASAVDGYLEINTASTAAKQVAYSSAANRIIYVTDNGTNSIVYKANMDMTSIATGASLSTGVKSLVELPNESCMLVAGDTGSTVWANKINSNTGANSQTLTVPTSITSLNGALGQKSGRLLLYGYDSVYSTGVVVAVQNGGTANEVRFGLAAKNNVYQTGVAASVVAALVDSNDNIYIAYNESNIVKIQKLKANGVLDTSFNSSGTPGTVATGLNLSNVRMSFTSSGSLALVGVDASNDINIVSCSADGSTVSTATTITHSAGSFASIALPVTTDIFADSNGDVYVIGYDGEDNSHTFVVGFDSSLAIDSSTTVFGTSGYLVTAASGQTPKALYAGYVQDDGRLILAGQSNNSKPVLMRLFSNPFKTHVQDTQTKTAAGMQDTTSDIGNGLNINTATGATAGTYKVARLVHAYEDGTGKLLLVCQGTSDTTIMRLQKDYTYDTTFNSSGTITLSGKTGATKLMVDESGNIFVTGYDSAAWLYACSNTGGAVSNLTAFAPATLPSVKTMSVANSVARQSLQRTLIAGYNSTDGSGCIMALTNDATSGTTSRDQSFGSNNGYYNTGVATAISDMLVDSNDRILFAYRSGTSVIVKRLLPHGANLDTTFATAGTLTIATAIESSASYDNQIKLARFSDNSIAVVYQTNDTTVTFRKYSSTGSSSSNTTITVPSGSTLKHIQIDSAGRLAAFGATATVPWVIRLNSSFSQDTSFTNGYTDGYGSAATGDLDIVYSGTLLPDNRYLIVGTNSGSTAALLARIYGDSYNTVQTQYRSLILPGVVDTRLALAAAKDHLVLSTDTNMIGALANATVKGMVLVNKTNYYILLSGLTDTYIAAVSVDGVVDTTFGTSGLVTISGKTGATSIIYTKAGTLLVAGNASNASWLREYTTAGAASSNSYTDTTAMSGLSALFQQATSRVVIAGKQLSTNYLMLAGYKPSGDVDPSFGTSGLSTQSVSTNGLTHAMVDSSNRIVAVYVDNSKHVTIACTDVHGRKLDQSFNSGSILDTNITTTTTASRARLLEGNSGKIIVAAGNSAGNIQVKRYTSAGAADTSYTSEFAFTAPTVTHMLLTSSGKLLIAGYDDKVNDDMFVIRLKADLTIDTSFGATTYAGSDGAGYITFKGNDALTTRQLGDGIALYNGQIVIVGSES